MSDTMESVQDQYANWARRLKGETLPIHDGEIEAGFWRSKRKDGGSDPVAIWYKDGVVKCRINNVGVDPDNIYGIPEDAPPEKERVRLTDIWTFIVKAPVSHEHYKVRVATGNWPGDNEAVTRSNNAPADDSFEGIMAQIDEMFHEAERLMKLGPAKTQVQANEASDVSDKLAKLWTKADKARAAEKQPHKEAAEAVDDKWRPLTSAASIYKRLKDAVVEPFLRAQKRAKEEAERLAREAADKARQEAAEKEAAAKRAADEAARQGNAAAAKRAEEARAAAEAARAGATAADATAMTVAATPITAGQRGRKTHLTTRTRVEVTDLDALVQQLKARPKVREVLESEALILVKAGVEVAGVKVIKDDDVV